MLKCHIRYRMADKQMDDVSKLIEATGLARNTLKKLYNNETLKTIKLETLMIVCNALNCSLSELIEYTPDEK